MKFCPTCKVTSEDFGKNKNTKDGLTWQCRSCHNAQVKASRIAVHGDQGSYHSMHRYGISSEEKKKMIEAQNGMCPICQMVPNSWHIDHNHETGKVRGVLCHHCNTALGNFRDSIKTLERAIAYLGGE